MVLRFSGKGTKEILGVAGSTLTTFMELRATTPNNMTHNNMQQGVQTDATFNIQQYWELLHGNVVSIKKVRPLLQEKPHDGYVYTKWTRCYFT